jgi:tetraacyldisaccharide 4'-kinase
MQFYLNFPQVSVAVGEKRNEAIPQLLHDRPETQVIILDDGFQHRSIQPGLSILLTDYNNLFINDFFLPTGDLRDTKSSYKRAQIIVVTKCIPSLSQEEKLRITEEINPTPTQQIFFSTINYATPHHILNHQHEFNLHKKLEVLLVTGIANSKPLQKYILEQCYTYEKISFSDHHIFSIDDLREVKRKFAKMDSQEKIILTTEKDAVRLVKFKDELENLPLFVLPIKHQILFDEETEFKNTISEFIKNFGN